MANIQIKVSHNNTIRRFACDEAPTTFNALESLIRSQIGVSSNPLQILYVDSDGDKLVIDRDEAWAMVLDLETKWKPAADPAYGAVKPICISLTATTPTHAGGQPTAVPLPSPRDAAAAIYSLASVAIPLLFRGGADLFGGMHAPHCAPRAETATKTPSSAEDGGKTTHAGITCDVCNMFPIVGIRYKSATKPDYDVCESCEASGAPSDIYLKIRTPELAPAIIFCIPQGSGGPGACPFPGFGGPCGGRRGGRFGRRCPGRQQQQPQSTTPSSPDASAPTQTQEEGELERAIYESLQTTCGDATVVVNASEVPSTPVAAPVTAAVADSSRDGVEEEKESSEDTVAPTSAPSEPVQPKVEETTAQTPTANTPSTSGAEDQKRLAKLWQQELLSLASMGFDDFAYNLALLQEHVVAPSGAPGNRGARGMGFVLGELLNYK